VAASGKSSNMQSFKDPTLRDAKFLIDLIDAIKPGSVDYELVTPGNNGNFHIRKVIY
jgi:plastin-1